MNSAGTIDNNVISGSAYMNMETAIERFDILSLVSGIEKIPMIAVSTE